VPARLPPESLGRDDWHNDLFRLLLDINVEVRTGADEQGRLKLIGAFARPLPTRSRLSDGPELDAYHVLLSVPRS
jgi:hypothetical protein